MVAPRAGVFGAETQGVYERNYARVFSTVQVDEFSEAVESLWVSEVSGIVLAVVVEVVLVMYYHFLLQTHA